MENVKKEIESLLQKQVGELTKDEIKILLEEPKEEIHGDFTTNIALILAKKLNKKPLDVAQYIVKTLNYQLSTLNFIDRVEAVAPGFINFWLSKEYLLGNLKDILSQKDNYGKGHPLQGQAPSGLSLRVEDLRGKKIMIEFTDPNPFKEFHIGHLYSNSVGESLSRLLESQGAIVRRVCYQGDVGLHVAKSIYGILNCKDKDAWTTIQKKTLEEKANFLGKCYAAGSKAYEKSQEAKEEINRINKKIYEGNDPKIKEIYTTGRQWSLEYYETIYKRLGTTFTRYYFESEAGLIGLECVKDHIADARPPATSSSQSQMNQSGVAGEVGRGIFEESQGAVIFPGEKYGLHNRVFINSIGLPTYEAKDMGLPQTKYKDFPYDESIIITANEQNGYFKVVLKALSLINPDLAAKTKHIGHGMVKLPSGKMSSRTGDVITGEWLLDEAKKRISSAYKEMDASTSEEVAVGAVKYALLKSSIGKDISFDFDQSISLEGNSGPYIQYTYARIRSVLAKFKIQSRSNRDKITDQNLKSSSKLYAIRYTLYAEEVALLRALNKFPDVIDVAASQFSPSHLCNYLFDLAHKFNLFYQKHQILDSDKKEFRLALSIGVGQVLKNGLYLLGIKAPTHM